MSKTIEQMKVEKHAYDKLKLVKGFILSEYNDYNLVDIELNKYSQCSTIDITLQDNNNNIYNTALSIDYNDLDKIVINHDNQTNIVEFLDIADLLTSCNTLIKSLDSI